MCVSECVCVTIRGEVDQKDEGWAKVAHPSQENSRVAAIPPPVADDCGVSYSYSYRYDAAQSWPRGVVTVAAASLSCCSATFQIPVRLD